MEENQGWNTERIENIGLESDLVRAEAKEYRKNISSVTLRFDISYSSEVVKGENRIIALARESFINIYKGILNG